MTAQRGWNSGALKAIGSDTPLRDCPAAKNACLGGNFAGVHCEETGGGAPVSSCLLEMVRGGEPRSDLHREE